MKNLQNITQNITVPSNDLEALKNDFPHCFDKNGDFDFDKFKKEFAGKEINFSKESYGMDWLGKSYARLLASDSATTLLKEDKDWNNKEENKNSENLLIKGDNLEVLKHLSNAYHEQVKMIYIDPPYNTGSDGFVYEDDRKFTVEQFQELAGVDEEKAKKILSFVNSKSNSHSAWLTFMYPRLYIAKQLLKDDGVIFVSIDDNEVVQLRILMDEVFGEENFVGQIVWQTATDNNPTQIVVEHEYVLCYVKNKNKQGYWMSVSTNAKLIEKKYFDLKEKYSDDIMLIQSELRKWIKENKKELHRVSHYDNVDERGVFHDADIANTKFGGYEYEIVHPITNKACKIPEKGYRFPESTMKEMIKNGDIVFGEDETTLPKPKKRLENVKDTLRSVLYEDGRSSTKELENLFNTKSIFNNPKSVTILKRIFNFITFSDDLILDFFAGSGTTGDAVMQLNVEDQANGKEGSRKYILVQLPEVIDPKKNKTAYKFVKNELKAEPTIFEITKERIIRAGKKIQAEQKADLFTSENKFDFGFKIFETMPIWEDYEFEAKEFDATQRLFDESKLSDEDIQTLLITWKTYDNIPLTQDLESVDLDEYVGYYGKGKLYLMDKEFKTKNLKALLNKIDTDNSFNPVSIIVFGYHFESKNLREIAENVASYANKKKLDIDFITRY
ncbi:MAG: site-specific DNA-methyltransferase [Candidatus Pacebacteria bacterium]|nr:site-specific DNA-methyltransferase [Candidatus Paceibacterota bacterium]